MHSLPSWLCDQSRSWKRHDLKENVVFWDSSAITPYTPRIVWTWWTVIQFRKKSSFFGPTCVRPYLHTSNVTDTNWLIWGKRGVNSMHFWPPTLSFLMFVISIVKTAAVAICEMIQNWCDWMVNLEVTRTLKASGKFHPKAQNILVHEFQFKMKTNI
jgi:hypothetical protein